MNTLLLDDNDFVSQHKVLIRDQRLKHLLEVIGAQLGDSIRVGKINALLGSGVISTLSTTEATLDITLDKQSPKPSSVSIICALPRPKALGRMIRSCTELGIKQITLINSYRVEKSYWQSPLLKESAIRKFCLEGLEQACDTILPSISLEKRFKPFVEDQLPQLINNRLAVLAHPSASVNVNVTGEQLNRTEPSQQTLLAIGPEGGFIDYEVEKFTQAGFKTITLGQRILRCETALPYAVSMLECR